MLSIFLIYFIGRSYAELAKIHGKSKWLFGILGIVVFYAGYFLTAFIIGILAHFSSNINNSITEEFSLTILGLLLGILTCWIFYKILKRNWSKNRRNISTFDENQIIDDQVINE